MSEIHLIGVLLGFIFVGFALNYNEVIEMIKQLWNEE